MRERLIPAVAGLLLASSPLPAQVRTAAGLDSLMAVAAADSADPEAHYRLGLGYWDMKRYDDAERSLRRAVAIDPHFASALLGLGYLPYARRPKLRKEEEKGKVPPELAAVSAAAKELRRRAIMIDPFARVGGSIDLVLLPAWAREPMSQKQIEKLPLEFFWIRGLYLAAGGEWIEALADLDRVLARLGAVQDATQDGLIPLVANEIRYVMAVIELRAGRTAAATRRLEEVLTHDVGLSMAHSRLAEIHERNGRFNAAVTERRRALDADPGDSIFLYELGFALARAGSLHEADTVLTRAMSINPLNAGIPVMAGRVRQTLGDQAGARRAYERFLAIAPSTRSRTAAEVRQKLAELR